MEVALTLVNHLQILSSGEKIGPLQFEDQFAMNLNRSSRALVLSPPRITLSMTSLRNATLLRYATTAAYRSLLDELRQTVSQENSSARVRALCKDSCRSGC
jgi:hypothetical protein